MRICYIIMDAFLCGGNKIIVEQANRLAARGYEMFIALLEYQNSMFNWIKLHPKVKVIKFTELLSDDNQMDAYVATYNFTCCPINNLLRPKYPRAKYYYFVQSIEDRFYDDEKRQIYAKSTYFDKGFELFTEAKWIVNCLKDRFHRHAIYIPNKLELPEVKKIETKKGKPIVLIEGNVEFQQKGVRDAWQAVQNIDCEKWLLSNSDPKFITPELKFDRVFHRVPWEKALSVIKTADILLKPSYFEGSPTPHMEAMSLGTALITTNCTGVEEYCIGDYNCLVVDIGDWSRMQDRVKLLIADKELRNKLIKNGLKTAETFNDWTPAIDELEMMFNWEKRRSALDA